MADIDVRHVVLLIEALARKTGTSTVFSGFDRMSDSVADRNKRKGNGTISITGDYLYRTYANAKKRNGKSRFSEEHLDAIANTLGFAGFQEFVAAADKPIDPLLRGYLGTWWSLVRANSGDFLLKAPVLIQEVSKQQVKIELKGGQLPFHGNVTFRQGTLFCELESGHNKKLYIVLKTGSSTDPQLLQGTFAGISSAGDPIAGIELFLRERKLSFENMRWEKLPLNNNNLDPRINQFFSRYEANCLKIGQISTYSLSDLSQLPSENPAARNASKKSTKHHSKSHAS